MSISVEGMDHIVLRVRDLDRSLGFYESLLGLPVVGRAELESGERPFLSVRVGATVLVDLWPDEAFDSGLSQQHSGFFHFCMRVDGSLDEVVKQLRTAGVEMLEEEPAVRFGATGFGRSIYVRDPDGYMVELKESKPERVE